MKDYYKILEIAPSDGSHKIKKAYRQLSKKYHPDINPNGEEYFKLIAEAYQTLSDPRKKELYDLRRNRPQTQANSQTTYQSSTSNYSDPNIYYTDDYPASKAKKLVKPFLIMSGILFLIISMIFVGVLKLNQHFEAEREETLRQELERRSVNQYKYEFIGGVFEKDELEVKNSMVLEKVANQLQTSNKRIQISFNFYEHIDEPKMGKRISAINNFFIDKGIAQNRIQYKWDQNMVESNKLKIDYYWKE